MAETCSLRLSGAIASQLNRISDETGRAKSSIIQQMWFEGRVVYLDPQFFAVVVSQMNKMEREIGEIVRELNARRAPCKELIEELLESTDAMRDTMYKVCLGQTPSYRYVLTTDIPAEGPVFERWKGESS